MRTLKKIAAFSMTMVLGLSVLAGCGSGKDAGSDSKGNGGKAQNVKVIDVDLTSEEYAFGVDKD